MIVIEVRAAVLILMTIGVFGVKRAVVLCVWHPILVVVGVRAAVFV
jgi:hypothetical protein